MRGRKLKFLSHLFRSILMLSIVSVLIHIPTFLELQIGSCINEKSIQNFPATPTTLRQTHLYSIYRLLTLKVLLTNLGPSVVVLILTVALIKEDQKRFPNSSHFSHPAKKFNGLPRLSKRAGNTISLTVLATKFCCESLDMPQARPAVPCCPRKRPRPRAL